MLHMLLALLLLVVVGGSQAGAGALPVHGFSFWTLDKEGFQRGHVWLVNKCQLAQGLEVLTIITPLGPPKFLQNFQISWRHRYGILTAGRFIPPIGREWQDYRIDRLQTIFFSSVSAPLVARDLGIEASGTLRKFTGKIGVFAGERMGGNVPISERDNPDLYLSGRFEPTPFLSVGFGQRFGPVKASTVDVLVNAQAFTGSAELVSSQGVLLYHCTFGYAITPRVSTVVRYEHLAKGERKWTIGFAYKPADDHEIKVNYIASKQNSNQIVVGQLVLRW